MDEKLLPEEIRQKATVSPGGEHAWHREDIVDAIEAGRAAGLACVGSEIQFHFGEGICEPYWLGFDPSPRRESELWEEYVDRAADEMLTLFPKRCLETDFVAIAKEWPFVAKKIEECGLNVNDHLMFVLYFDGAERS